MLLCAAALFGAATVSAQQASPASAALSPAEAQRALDTLQDPEKRDRLIEALQAIARASPPPIPEKPETNAEPAVPLPPDSLGAQLLEALASGAERLASDAAAAAQTAIDSRLLWGWARRVAADPAQRRAAIDGTWQLALVLIGALLVEGFASAVVRRPIAALMAHAPRNGSGNGAADNAVRAGLPRYRESAWRLLRRLPFALTRLLLDLVPVAVFVGIAALLAGIVPGPTTRAVILAATMAYAITQIVLSLGRMLVSPAAGRLRLVHIADSQAEYLICWLRRLTVVAVWGGALAQIALLLGLAQPVADTLMRLVALIVAVMAVILVLRGRHAVAHYLRAPPDADAGVSRWRNGIAGIWHYLAIVAIAGLWILWAAGMQHGLDGLRFLLATLALLVLARLAAIIVLGTLDRAARLSPGLSRRFPGLETRTARYQAPARLLVNLLIAAGTAIVLLQLWGADAFFWFEGGRIGARLLSALATIALAAVAAILVWEGANAALERRLALMSDAGSAAHAARLRTLLPMLRAALFVAIVAVVGLTALSEIGVNAARCWPAPGLSASRSASARSGWCRTSLPACSRCSRMRSRSASLVTVAGLSGTVEDLSIRAIWLRGDDGAVHIVPFSAVTSITNSSRGLANAEISVSVAAKEDSDRVAAALRDIAAEMRRDPDLAPMVLGDLEVWVDALKASSTTLAGKLACAPAGRAAVEHEFNRRLQKRFQELGIELAG